eukprot:COSAG01_NODE_17564_length_1140_cov_1.864553_1_plen_40_part_10
MPGYSSLHERPIAAIGRPAIRKVGTLGADFGSVRIALGKR